jgi:GT2 family glycosyltransferase
MLDRLRATDVLLNDAILSGTPKRYYPQRALIGAALLATPDTFAIVGDFDPVFTFYGPDDDYSNRAYDMGVPLLVAIQAHMLHKHGRIGVTPKMSRKAWLGRWRSSYRGRMILELKSPTRSLAKGYLRITGLVLRDIPLFVLRKFPAGSVVAFRTLMELLGKCGQMRDRRRLEARLKAEFQART